MLSVRKMARLVMIEGEALDEMIIRKISRTMQTCARASQLIMACSDGPSPELDVLQGLIDRVQSEAVQFCRRIETSAPYRTADDVSEG